MRNTARTVALQLKTVETVATHQDASTAEYQVPQYKTVAEKHVMSEIIHLIPIKFV